MDNIESWPFIQNFFENRTRENMKVANILAVDHDQKLSAAAMTEGAVIAGLHGEWAPYMQSWRTAYSAWQLHRSAWHACTAALEHALRDLLVSPGPEKRSVLDEWESAIAAQWPRSSALYEYFFPEGRDEFTTGQREKTIEAVELLSKRLTEKLPLLQQQQAAAQAAVDGHINNGEPVPPEKEDALETANARVRLVNRTAERTNAFHSRLNTARSEQQSCEQKVTDSTRTLEKERQRLCRRMLKNFHRLADLRCDTESADPDPQYRAASFFDLNVLMRPKSEDPPEDNPPPQPAPPAP